MELHRLVFRLDYPNAFTIFSKWGEILSALESCDTWPELGEDTLSRGIMASREDKSKNKVHLLNVRVNDIDGVLEGHPIPSYRDFDDGFQRINRVLSLLDVKEYKRLGVRFFFLEPQASFESACKLLASQVRTEYWNLFDHAPSDIGIVSVHGDDDQALRLSTGPLKRTEYTNWFNAHSAVKPDNAMLFDIDCYTRSYRDSKFDLRKLVALYYDKALSEAERVLQFIQSGS